MKRDVRYFATIVINTRCACRQFNEFVNYVLYTRLFATVFTSGDKSNPAIKRILHTFTQCDVQRRSFRSPDEELHTKVKNTSIYVVGEARGDVLKCKINDFIVYKKSGAKQQEHADTLRSWTN